MDIGDTIAPSSEQLDAVDLLAGPRTFTVQAVTRGNDEQPVQIQLSEFPRPWRPGKSMRRVLVAVWGPDASAYVGRRLTLFCDESVRFGGQAVGGVRISAMSHLAKRKAIPLLVSRGKSAMFAVDPLPDQPESPQQPTQAADDVPPRMRGKMFALFGQVLDTDEKTAEGREERLAFIANAIGQRVESSKELNRRQVDVVIQMLEAEQSRREQQTEEPPLLDEGPQS